MSGKFKIITNDGDLFNDLAFMCGRDDRWIVIEGRSWKIVSVQTVPPGFEYRFEIDVESAE